MGSTGSRRRGRRSDGADTRGELLVAASQEFAAHGLDGASLRGIARRADVDPSLVHHYFSSKEELFTESLALPVDLAGITMEVVAAGRDDAAEHVVRALLMVWGRMDGQGLLRAVVGSVVRSELVRDLVRELVLRRLLVPMTTGLGVDQPERRASLVASQMVGLGMVRYIIRVEPLASATDEEVVTDVAPTVHRYLFDPLG